MMAKTAPITVLMDPATISANRDGVMTSEQRKHATPTRADVVVVIVLSILFPGLMTFAVVHHRKTLALYHLLHWPDVLDTLIYYLLALVGIASILLSLRSLYWYIRLRRELAEPIIEQVEGQVVYSRFNAQHACYQARTPAFRLWSTDGMKEVLLPPGVYHFFYLPFSRRVLSAEWVRAHEPGGPYMEMVQALMQAHHFTADDLEYNRQGKLSPAQEARWPKDQRPARSRGAPLVMKEGVIGREMSSLDGETEYTYDIPKVPFGLKVSKQAYYALVPGVRYRVSYLVSPRVLLSIEPLEPLP
jgi:hypothetical protein